MALIFRGKTECPLCDAVIGESDEIVATSHFIADPEDPLWHFSDAGMHKNCFLGWSQRQVFIEKYNQTIGSITWGDGRRHHMNTDGTITLLKWESEDHQPHSLSNE